MGAASLVGFGCCAVLLFSFIEYLGQAQTSHDGQSMVGLQSDPFSLRTLASYIVPLLQGPPYNDIFTGFSGAVGLRGYFGPVASVLALAAVIDWTGRRANVRGFPRILYALVSIVLLLKRFGVPGPQSLGTLPVLNQITMDKYDEAIIAFCVAALVAYSIEAFARRAAFVGPLIFAAAAVLGVLTAVLADRALIPGQVAERLAYFDGSLYLALAFIAGLLATSLFRGHTRRSGVGAVFVLASLVIASSFTSYFVPLYYLVDRSAALSESALLGAPYIAALKNVLADGRRVFSPDHVLYPDWSAAFGIEDVRALDALYDYRYTPFLTAFRNGRASGGGP